MITPNAAGHLTISQAAREMSLECLHVGTPKNCQLSTRIATEICQKNTNDGTAFAHLRIHKQNGWHPHWGTRGDEYCIFKKIILRGAALNEMMITQKYLAPIFMATLACFFASCASQKPEPAIAADGKPVFVNPHPPGTHEHFMAEPNYRKTYDVWKNEPLLDATNPSNSWVKIILKDQRAFLMNGEQVAMDYPICSGTPSHPTPKGTFFILEKIVDKHSNKYGKILDAAGDVVNSDADSTEDTIPEGGKFVGAQMRYWMRLTNDGVGHHIGNVRRRPASHACIRGPSKIMPVVYSKVKVGSRFIVE
ncbi:MAG: hypothetical protein EAZ42_01340 [Verrucomicrobia bacterium]|nr:MAG: hypothetical protein EAZ42_01340 [Verrucomicrobiota bacterium]